MIMCHFDTINSNSPPISEEKSVNAYGSVRVISPEQTRLEGEEYGN